MKILVCKKCKNYPALKSTQAAKQFHGLDAAFFENASEEEKEKITRYNYEVVCNNCVYNSDKFTHLFESKEDAVIAWNKRNEEVL